MEWKYILPSCFLIYSPPVHPPSFSYVAFCSTWKQIKCLVAHRGQSHERKPTSFFYCFVGGRLRLSESSRMCVSVWAGACSVHMCVCAADVRQDAWQQGSNGYTWGGVLAAGGLGGEGGGGGVSVSSLIMCGFSMLDHCREFHNIHTQTRRHTYTPQPNDTELWLPAACDDRTAP